MRGNETTQHCSECYEIMVNQVRRSRLRRGVLSFITGFTISPSFSQKLQSSGNNLRFQLFAFVLSWSRQDFFINACASVDGPSVCHSKENICGLLTTPTALVMAIASAVCFCICVPFAIFCCPSAFDESLV